jgi:GH3 auxin-responsive promoter
VKAATANALWLAGCMPEYRRFRRAVERVEEEQRAILSRVLAENAETEFGRAHGFARLRSLREYQERVPLRDYADFGSWMERIVNGAPNVLAREPVRLLEPTSGTSSGNTGGSVTGCATKLIPYTRGLEREFQAGIRSWIADLFLNDRQLLAGEAYWSVSPAIATQQRTRGGIAIGFEDDTSYVGGWQRRLVQAAMAVPAAVREIRDMEIFRYVTLLFVARSRRLKLISVWNPAFLTLLVERLAEWGEDLAHDLERGTARSGPMRRGVRSEEELPRGVREWLRADARRARELRTALRAPGSRAELHRALWPELRLISCWADANAAGPAAQLAALFPQARVQAKGLIATEGFVSLPLAGREGAALAVRSHFLEFLPLDEGGDVNCDKPLLAHELERGARYNVVLTTSGGLYRYQLNDVIEVAGHWRECAIVRFVGRQGQVSDWYGEKLNEAHVARALQEAFGEARIAPGFAMLACEASGAAPGYVLYVDTIASDDGVEAAAREIEVRLRENFHYDYARRLGQLAELRVAHVRGAAEKYLAARMRKGQRAGDVKPVALDGGAGWAEAFSREASA